MSMIEGIGDEVIQFFGVIIVISCALIAWWSTNISEGPLIRTVLILERRTRGRTTNESTPQSSVTISRNENTIDTGQVGPANMPELVENEAESGSNSSDKDENESESSLLLSNNLQTPTVQRVSDNSDEQSQDVLTPLLESSSQTTSQSESQQQIEHSQDIVIRSDADSTILRKRRLAFFQNRGPTLIEASDTTENERDVMPTANTTTEEEESSTANPDHIRIRLKYLNDDQIVVEGRLQEQLGDFKRRHFSIELAAEKMVRLIFNGQVLQSDNQTLQGYGLFDNCVVHCLIHNQRSNAPRSAQPQANSGSNQTTPPDWNLGTLLYTCLSVILGFAWYCRYQYSHLFTMTTTAALFGLTSIFAVTLLSIYLPDQDTIQ